MKRKAAPMTDVTLYLVRHGQTIFNIYDKMQGWGNSPLTEQGQAQAQAVGERLADTRFAAAYCSDTTRAQQTAQAILDANRAGAPAAPISSPFFREEFYGSFEGTFTPAAWFAAGAPEGLTSFAEIVERHSIGAAKDLLKAADPFHDAESNAEYWARVDQGFDLIRANTALRDGDTVLVISHGNTLLSLMERYGQGRYDLTVRPGNGSVTRLRLTDDTIEVLGYNE
ncbi:MAG: histidine phosphatase family protein [Microbacteriaceae bacterium]|jgi:probable phosphoglycerate mutase|nr:histidine phosphatase family protein [Microbacteriaceae bacterium]MCI1206672.1 histidine phosphatase family protein [Microbacteriaceae bacterium]